MPNDNDPAGPADVEKRPFADSLCWRCTNHRAIRAARSLFVMCTVLPVKYPRQPVTTCPSFHAVRSS